MLSVLLSCLVQATSASPNTSTTDLQVKVSLGLPVFATRPMIGIHGSTLLGARQSPWLFGIQGMGFTEIFTFDSPGVTLSAIHALAVREIAKDNSWHFSVLAGPGMAYSTERGKFIEFTSLLTAEYEPVKKSGPSVLLGLNVGKSWHHSFGLSFNAATAINQLSTGFASFQLDYGEWD